MHTRCRRLLVASTFLCTTLLPLIGHAVSSQAEGERLVLAFYYPWFDENTWNSGRTPDLPHTPYNSDDRTAMFRQVDQAQSAGIGAFVLNWWGKGNRTEKNLKALLDVAAEKGFRVSVDFDINSPVMGGVASYAENLRHLHTVHAAHPAYLSVGGRPVVFFYNVSRLPVATWRSLRDQVDPERSALWIAEGTDLAYLPVFDGHHLYSVTWPNRVPPSQTLSTWGDRVRTYNRDHGTDKLWVATVMPGYDDRKVRAQAGFSRSRDGGDYYRQSWEAAIASQPQWVIVNSFNEWMEGSHIEPSQAYGSLYLDLTREWAGRFRSAEYARLSNPAAPPAPASGPPEPAPTPSPPDYAVRDGWFFSQGGPAPDEGFAVTDGGGVPLWEHYRSAGGPLSIGFPTSGRYYWDRFVVQDFQSGVLAWHPSLGRVHVLDAFDEGALAELLAASR
jgi:hypothetical protein